MTLINFPTLYFSETGAPKGPAKGGGSGPGPSGPSGPSGPYGPEGGDKEGDPKDEKEKDYRERPPRPEWCKSRKCYFNLECWCWKWKKRRKTKVLDNGSIVIDPLDQEDGFKIYNTISCPCSSYAVLNSNGEVGCERDFFGDIQYVNPIVLKNHFIEENSPKVGDKWICSGGINCNQGDFKWDTFHVVQVEENKTEISSNLFDSRYSTSNCYIPPSTLRDYVTGKSNYVNPDGIGGIDINTINEWIDGLPLFETQEQAIVWDTHYGKKENQVSEYYDNGVIKYIPGKHYPKQSLISSVFINNKNILKQNIISNWNYKSYSSQRGKTIINNKEGEIVIKILSENNPTFEILIEDSSKCSVLNKRMKITSSKEEYIFKHKIPNLDASKTKETYDIKIIPAADVKYYDYESGQIVMPSIVKHKVWQFRDPKFIFQASSSSISNTSTSQTKVIIPGKVNKYSDETLNFSNTTHVTTVTRSSGSDKYYINNTFLYLPSLVTDNNAIKKVIVEQEDKKELECRYEIKIADSLTNWDSNDEVLYRGDVEVGMRFIGEIEKTKTITKVIDLDIHKEPCDDCDKDLDILTNKFELNNTNNLFSGMKITGTTTGDKEFTSALLSVDGEQCVTFKSKHTLAVNTELVFTYSDSGVIDEINNNFIKTESCIRLPNNTELTFRKNNVPSLHGRVTVDKSGDTTIIATTTIDSLYFGQDDVTYTLDPDLFITNTPNACDQHINVGKDTPQYINFVNCDNDLNRHAKVVTITKESNSGAISVARSGESSVDYYKIYTPNPGFKGKDTIKFTVSDGANTSEEKTIHLTVK